MKQKRLLLFGCLLVGMFLTGCNRSDEKKKFKIGFSQCTMFDDWRKTMVNEMTRELIFYDNMELILKDAEGDNQKQANQILELMDEKIDLLIVSPNEADPITPAVEKVFAKGIPVIIVDRKINSSSYTAYVGADNKYIGETIGRYVANLLNRKGNVVEVWGLKGSTAFIERHRGFKEAISKYPEIKVTPIEGDWGVKRDAEAAFRDLILKGSSYDLVFAHNDIMALAAHRVYQDLGTETRIDFIGVDGLAGPGGGMENVSKGVLKASALYPTGGDRAIQVASDILTGRSFERENLLKTVVIDSSNVFVMQMQAEKILHQQKDILRQDVKNQEQIQVFNSQRILIYFLLASLVVLIVVSGIAILAWRDKKEANWKLEGKSREIAAQRDTIVEMADKAEVAIQEKLKFFTNISHEFKTPLTLIMGPADSLLTAGTELKDRSKQQVLLIKKNAARLLRLINQLMDFRKIEEKKMSIHASENDIVQFSNDIISSFQDLAKSRKIQLLFSSDHSSLNVWFDPGMLDKVIFNLLSNAFKFTPDRGRIAVSIALDKDRKNILMSVEDNGEGMSKESFQHAFDRFYSGEALGGTGLGLSLSKELMELHHGDLVLTSEKGKGTRFCIVLPAGNEHFSESEIQITPAAYSRNPAYYFLEDPSIQSRQAEEDDTILSKEKTLLIIEDNEELRGFLKNQFAPYYNVTEAVNGIEGLRMVFETVPDIVICDVMIPGKDGFEVTRTLKNDLRTSHIPVVILTAKGATEQRIEGIQTGADDYITKPFAFDLLHERLRALLRTRDALREHYSQDISIEHTATPSGLDKKFLNNFRALVEKNIDNSDFNVNDIGPELGMSRVQVYRKVKALLDCSVYDYIVSVRLKKAQYFLLNTDKTVAEISSEVGFSSPNYFSTAFKAKFNVTPKEFKQSQD
jgi:signal transduction histidine kinase/CheY-like chemotaxis protein